VLPVELNATLKPAADFAKAPMDGSGCRKACSTVKRRSTFRPTIDAVVRPGAGRGSQALDEPTSARGLVANHAFKHFLGMKNGIQ
jgi:hypothetical protein